MLSHHVTPLGAETINHSRPTFLAGSPFNHFDNITNARAARPKYRSVLSGGPVGTPGSWLVQTAVLPSPPPVGPPPPVTLVGVVVVVTVVEMLPGVPGVVV